MRPARGNYPCKVCGTVMHSPGALGGHVTSHHTPRLPRECPICHGPCLEDQTDTDKQRELRSDSGGDAP